MTIGSPGGGSSPTEDVSDEPERPLTTHPPNVNGFLKQGSRETRCFTQTPQGPQTNFAEALAPRCRVRQSSGRTYSLPERGPALQGRRKQYPTNLFLQMHALHHLTNALPTTANVPNSKAAPAQTATD